MAKGIIRKVTKAKKNVEKQISDFASRSRIASGLAGEGYNGGYRDALNDVLLALNGVTPNRKCWWEEDDE